MKWTDAVLDRLRHEGDPEADAVITQIFERGELREVQRLIRGLQDNDDPVPEALPDEVEAYFEDMGSITDAERREAAVGEKFFAVHGPEIMMVLCCASLPFDYANYRGVDVLYRTGFLKDRPARRVAQTAQMILDVMRPGGLTDDGYGIRSAQKVRLMHAAIRYMILHSDAHPWDVERVGVPINQADLLYTLMSFTQVVLDGMDKLRLGVTPREAEAYLGTWCTVGRLMGIDPEMLPSNVAEARVLTQILARRNHGASEAGKAMTDAIAGLIGDVLGEPLRAFRWSLLRFFNPPETCQMLGIPRHPVRDRMAHGVVVLSFLLDQIVDRPGPIRIWFRNFSVNMIQHYIEAELGPATRSFRIPTRLHGDWKASTRRSKGWPVGRRRAGVRR